MFFKMVLKVFIGLAILVEIHCENQTTSKVISDNTTMPKTNAANISGNFLSEVVIKANQNETIQSTSVASITMLKETKTEIAEAEISTIKTEAVIEDQMSAVMNKALEKFPYEMNKTLAVKITEKPLPQPTEKPLPQPTEKPVPQATEKTLAQGTENPGIKSNEKLEANGTSITSKPAVKIYEQKKTENKTNLGVEEKLQVPLEKSEAVRYGVCFWAMIFSLVFFV